MGLGRSRRRTGRRVRGPDRPVLGDSGREHDADPRADRRPRRRCRPGRVGGRRLGGPRRAATSCSPTRRSSPATRPAATASPRARSRELRAARPRATGCARTRSTRACAPTASARRCTCPGPAARCPTGARAVAAHRARRPPAHHRDQGRRRGPSTAPARSTYDGRRPGRGGRLPRRATATYEVGLPAAGGRRRRPLAARQGCSAGSGTATRSTAWPAAPTSTSDARRRPLDQLAPRAARRPDGEILSGYGWIFPLGGPAR